MLDKSQHQIDADLPGLLRSSSRHQSSQPPPRGLSLLSFVYCLLDPSGAHLTGTECVMLLLPNLQDDHQFSTLYNQTRNRPSDFTLEPLSVLLLDVQSLSVHSNIGTMRSSTITFSSMMSLTSTSASTASLLLFLCSFHCRRVAAPTAVATVAIWLICSFG
ncbi:hypothetical protein BHM03_00052015 [Ensete ventricosum]|nr:hypothetical protein BHM03_00052015 [Ensete ventricosum]